MRSLHAVLNDLLVLSESVVARPVMGDVRRVSSQLADIAREVRYHDGLPAEGERATRAAAVMVTAIEEFMGGEERDARAWLMIAGGVLPLVRSDAYRAMVAERGAR